MGLNGCRLQTDRPYGATGKWCGPQNGFKPCVPVNYVKQCEKVKAGWRICLVNPGGQTCQDKQKHGYRKLQRFSVGLEERLGCSFTSNYTRAVVMLLISVFQDAREKAEGYTSNAVFLS